jgi:hypothetical protein
MSRKWTSTIKGKEDHQSEVRIFMEIKSKASKILLNKDKHTNGNLVFFHQNIRGLSGKIDKLNCSITSKSINPHLICLSEHYMTDFRI